MRRFELCRKWLLTVSIVVLMLGLFMSLALPFMDPTEDPFTGFLWQDGVAKGAGKFYAWAMSVWGATLAGWGLTLAFLVQYPFKNRERWAWNAIALGIAVWYPLDTYFSYHFGVVLNCLLNTVLLAAVLVPLLLTRSELRR